MYGAMLGIAEGIAVSLRLLEVFIVLGGAFTQSAFSKPAPNVLFFFLGQSSALT
jgi:hypothetical protein